MGSLQGSVAADELNLSIKLYQHLKSCKEKNIVNLVVWKKVLKIFLFLQMLMNIFILLQEAFGEMLYEAGFTNVKYENLTFGVVAIHDGFKI